jgi:hypothetical protein
VVVGLVFVSLFTEAYGWTYAGLVVPGYLAATLVVAPFTALLILFESALTHACVAATARIIPERTAAWSTAFGRERFFLYVVIAIIVRLFVEGSLVPWATQRFGLTHSRELYSIGLVLVPLVANVFWSSGIGHAGPRLLVLTGLTYFFVDNVLLEHTNFSLSRFMVANESVALHFLDTPKAYMLLLVGAMLGARGNVKYGWDYNGILVPALLAVAWYEPMRLLGTMLEAISIYLLARFLASVPPFSHVALVGPRRTLFVGVLGFFMKLALGHLLMRSAPTVELTDYLGFGYILPSLLAVKMWNKLRIGIVVMPTLQVSLMAFFVGNALGFSLNWLFSVGTETHAQLVAPRHSETLPLDWLDLSQEVTARPGQCPASVSVKQFTATISGLLDHINPRTLELQQLDKAGLELIQGDGPYWIIAPKQGDGPLCPGLRIALSPEYFRQGRRLAIVTKSAFPSAMPTSLRIANASQAPLIVAISADPIQAATETQILDELAESFTILELGIDNSSSNTPPTTKPAVELRVVGELPSAIDLVALERALSQKIELRFSDERTTHRHGLYFSTVVSNAIAATQLGYEPLETANDSLRRSIAVHLEELITRDYLPPTTRSLRLLDAVVLPGLDTNTDITPWTLAVATQLGYRIRATMDPRGKTYLLYEPASSKRHGNATLIVRPDAENSLAIEVPAPLWEAGVLSYGLALFETEGAKYAVIAGAKPDVTADGRADPRRAQGRISYFQHLHEALLGKGVDVVAVHGMRPDIPIEIEVVAELTFPVIDPKHSPPVIDEVLNHLAESGLSTAYYSADISQVSIGAQSDPAFAFAERYAPQRMARLWFSQGAREKAPKLPPSDHALIRILDRSPADVDVAANCFARLRARATEPRGGFASVSCDVDLVARQIEQWLVRNNPFDRIEAKRLGRDCGLYAGLDTATMIPWISIVGNGRARLVPLHHPNATGKRTKPLKDERQVRRALEMGIATVVVEEAQ